MTRTRFESMLVRVAAWRLRLKAQRTALVRIVRGRTLGRLKRIHPAKADGVMKGMLGLRGGAGCQNPWNNPPNSESLSSNA
jgi:hypothetical protein